MRGLLLKSYKKPGRQWPGSQDQQVGSLIDLLFSLLRQRFHQSGHVVLGLLSSSGWILDSCSVASEVGILSPVGDPFCT